MIFDMRRRGRGRVVFGGGGALILIIWSIVYSKFLDKYRNLSASIPNSGEEGKIGRVFFFSLSFSKL